MTGSPSAATSGSVAAGAGVTSWQRGGRWRWFGSYDGWRYLADDFDIDVSVTWRYTAWHLSALNTRGDWFNYKSHRTVPERGRTGLVPQYLRTINGHNRHHRHLCVLYEFSGRLHSSLSDRYHRVNILRGCLPEAQ